MFKKNHTHFFMSFVQDFAGFFRFFNWYARSRFYHWFTHFELAKDVIVDLLYKKRGRYTKPFLHLAFLGLVFLVISVGPLLLKNSDSNVRLEDVGGALVTNAYGGSFYTQQSEEVRKYRGGEVITHYVVEGESLNTIAERYGLEVDTILWENNIGLNDKLKPGMELKILPVDGVRHRVARGETVYSIAKKYGLDESQAQMIIDYPFNEFLNDETFELAINQYILVPEGERKVEKKLSPSGTNLAKTPDAGSVKAMGTFAWPASGGISQGYKFYHKAIDIANKSGGQILAADSGTVVVAGFVDNSGYGNRVMVDHGNGYATLYAHLSSVQVKVGQTVARGNVIGQMGSTGRSTGTHLHFEIRKDGALLNPLQLLK